MLTLIVENGRVRGLAITAERTGVVAADHEARPLAAREARVDVMRVRTLHALMIGRRRRYRPVWRDRPLLGRSDSDGLWAHRHDRDLP